MSNSCHEDFLTEFLKEHNRLRGEFGNVKPLELDTELNSKAQSHANYLAENKLRLQNSSDESVGENLYYLESEDGVYEAKHIIDYWLKRSNIDFDKREKPQKTNHFTQIVWRSSEKLGVGVSKSESGAVYLVAFYYPRGNIVNYLEDNVLLHSETSEFSDSSDPKEENHERKKHKKTDDKVAHILEKIVKRADKEKSGKVSLTKAKKVFQLINEKFGTNYTNMDAKKFFEQFENLDTEHKIGQKDFRRALLELNLKL